MRSSRFAPLAPIVLLGACLGGRARLDETMPDRRLDGGVAGTIGVGSGTGTIACSACAHAGSMSGTSWTIQLMKRVSPQLRAGWTVDTWLHSGSDWERGTWDLNAVLFYYPSIERGFFIAGGPGYAMMYATVTDTTALQRHGWGFMAEMGYEQRLRSASLTPFVQYSRAWVGDIYYPKGSGIPWAQGWKHQVLSVGLGVTFHNRRKKPNDQ